MVSGYFENIGGKCSYTVFSINFNGFTITFTGFIPRNKNRRHASSLYFRFFHPINITIFPPSLKTDPTECFTNYFKISEQEFMEWLSRIRINHILGHSESDLISLRGIYESLLESNS